jgi:uncharacterized membrane protein YcaP (DUF421 family)
MQGIYQHIDWLFGLSQIHISLLNMVARALLIYVLGIIILNLINKRFIGEKTPFDIILIFLIGSSLANAVTGNSPYFPTLGMVFCIILVNWLLSLFSFYNQTAEKILKGVPVTLYKNGKLHWKAMRLYHFTHDDLISEVRKDSGLLTLDEVQEIILENSGEISVIPKKDTKIYHANMRNNISDY